MLHELKLYNTECTDYKSKLRYANLHLISLKKKKLSEDSKNTIKIEFYGNYFMVQALQD